MQGVFIRKGVRITYGFVAKSDTRFIAIAPAASSARTFHLCALANRLLTISSTKQYELTKAGPSGKSAVNMARRRVASRARRDKHLKRMMARLS